jgi:hypothetical protein
MNSANITTTGGEVHIGTNAGSSAQGNGAVAIGNGAGQTTQGQDSVAIGIIAGNSGQGTSCVAIGDTAGTTGQGNSSVAIGLNAGATNLGANSIAIGPNSDGTGANGIAIGDNADTSTYTNSIALSHDATCTANNQFMLGSVTAGTSIQSVLPGLTNNTDLGSSSLKFKDVHINGNYYQAGNAGEIVTNGLGTADNYTIGSSAGAGLIAGANDNILIGSNTGDAITTGDCNTILGHASGGNLITGTHNTLLGSDTNVDASTGEYRIALGYSASSNQNKHMVIGSNAAGTTIDVIKAGIAGNTDLGSNGRPFKDLYLRPSSSLSTNNNGDLVIEATNNTTLTFKLKGTDGTERSGTITLITLS